MYVHTLMSLNGLSLKKTRAHFTTEKVWSAVWLSERAPRQKLRAEDERERSFSGIAAVAARKRVSALARRGRNGDERTESGTRNETDEIDRGSQKGEGGGGGDSGEESAERRGSNEWTRERTRGEERHCTRSERWRRGQSGTRRSTQEPVHRLKRARRGRRRDGATAACSGF